jgi:hypothetical protein
VGFKKWRIKVGTRRSGGDPSPPYVRETGPVSQPSVRSKSNVSQNRWIEPVLWAGGGVLELIAEEEMEFFTRSRGVAKKKGWKGNRIGNVWAGERSLDLLPSDFPLSATSRLRVRTCFSFRVDARPPMVGADMTTVCNRWNEPFTMPVPLLAGELISRPAEFVDLFPH